MDDQPLIENDTSRSTEIFHEKINKFFIDFLAQSGLDHEKTLYSIIPNAEQQLNTLLNEMQVTGNKHFNQSLAFKIIFQVLTLSSLLEDESVDIFEKGGLPYLKNAIELTESLKLQPEILLVYMLCFKIMSEFQEKKDDKMTSQK